MKTAVPKTESPRLAWVDAARALAIYLVILGHTLPNTHPVYRFLFAFHMPAFFFLSGYCFHYDPQRASFGRYTAGKVRSLLIPYGIFCLLGVLIMQIFPAEWRPEQPLRWFLVQYFYYTQPPALGQSWFLVCLFFASLILFCIFRLQTEVKPRWLILSGLLLAFAGTVVAPRMVVVPYERIPWMLDSAMAAVPFMIAGYLLRQRGFPVKLPKSLRLAGILLLPVLIWLFGMRLNGRVNLCDRTYDHPVCYYAAAMAGCLWISLLGQLLEEQRWMTWLGRNSLPIFGIHSFVLWCWVTAAGRIVGDLEVRPAGIRGLVLPVLTYLCCVPFAVLWNHSFERLIRKKGA